MGKLLLALLIAGVVLVAQAADEEITLTDFTGEPRTIESFAGDGRWLVVMIWAHNCHVCNQEAEAYAQFHEAHRETDAHVLGVSLDGAAQRADAEAFIERHDLPFPNLIGEPRRVMLNYLMLTQSQFRGTPSILLYDPEGKLRAAQAGAVPTASIEAYIARNSGEAGAAG
jgi:peroxiredoxin